MKKTTLLSMILCFLLFAAVKAQITAPKLIISEFSQLGFYVEFTNVDNIDINLKDFKFASVHDTRQPDNPEYGVFRFPDHILKPGESYVVAKLTDWAWKSHPYSPSIGQMHPRGLDTIAQLVAHPYEGGPEGEDLVNDFKVPEFLRSRNNPFLEYHQDGDSVLVDLISATLDSETGEFFAWPVGSGKMDVAGVTLAYGPPWEYVFVRKSNVTQGSLDWDKSRGTDAEDSEWILIPYERLTNSMWANRARYFTTPGHHGEAFLNSETVKSTVINIDWNNSVMSVPWGIEADSIFDYFELAGGISWLYKKNDAGMKYNTVQTGDSLIFYAVGTALKEKKFRLVQMAPANDIAKAFPINSNTYYNSGDVGRHLIRLYPYYVTSYHQPVIDTIGNVGYATRVDSLFKYIETAPGATLELEWVDGTERVDLKRGDILRITAANETTTKSYYIDADTVPALNTNAKLGAITWPEAPSYVRANPIWNEDTIPGFSPDIFMYEMQVPYGSEVIPALVATPQHVNAKVSVERATQLRGSRADRTTTFTVRAQADTIIAVYSVTFELERPSVFKQPYRAEPFISELLTRQGGALNSLEVYNPGSEPLDLSDYLIATDFGNITPGELFRNVDNYGIRYRKYVYGYQYVPQEQFTLTPAMIQKDHAVNPIVLPGETFCITANTTGSWMFDPNGSYGPHWYNYLHRASRVVLSSSADIHNFWFVDPELHGIANARVIGNPDITNNQSLVPASRIGWSYWLLKIVNDSIKNGTKGLVDIADFELIDYWGDYTGEVFNFWSPGTAKITNLNHHSFRRKPEIYKGNPLPGVQGSWADTDEESEWIIIKDTQIGSFNANTFAQLGSNIGIHSSIPVTVYLSTINSNHFKVSEGYASPQKIEGLQAGTTVAQFLDRINKENPDQSLSVMGKEADGTIVENDTLVVTSADGVNVTKYSIHLGTLDNNAVLTSTLYTVSFEGSEGVIDGIPFGTTLKQVLSNVNKPAKAVITIIDGDNNSVPLHRRNHNLDYVDVKAGESVFFEVVAEDMQTKITYQLKLDVSDDKAFVYSNVYDVDQSLQYISLILQGSSVQTFFNSISTNAGATYKLVDKIGIERLDGNVRSDDVLVVTSPDGNTHKNYYLAFLGAVQLNLAYVLSDVYNVYPEDMTITNIPLNTTINTFLGFVIPAPQATVSVINAEGQTVASGEIQEGYKLKVVSGDGSRTVTYSLLEYGVSVAPGLKLIHLKVYPNPATDEIRIEGIVPNSQLTFINIYGQVVKVLDSNNIGYGAVSISDLPKGIYFITVRSAEVKSAPVKLVK